VGSSHLVTYLEAGLPVWKLHQCHQVMWWLRQLCVPCEWCWPCVLLGEPVALCGAAVGSDLQHPWSSAGG